VKTLVVMPAHSRSKNGVASLAYVAGIHVLLETRAGSKTWMAGTSPAMTAEGMAILKRGKYYSAKLVPQPQEAVAWGLLILNEEPIRSSTKSISEPAM
jgi:hypothetical protein